jgi:mevalonate kinase
MGRGTGYGKTILIGDQFVLYEVPAVVSALPFETVAEVRRVAGEGWVLEDNRREVPGYRNEKKEQQIKSINRILDAMKIDTSKTALKITFGGALLAGSGVGASAASCVSLARALNHEFELGLSIDEINHMAWQGEFAYHGLPSGVDNTASTYGGLLLYQVRKEKKLFERIRTPQPLEVVLANSGVTADTSLLRGATEKQREESPDLFWSRLEKIKEQVSEVKNALEAGDLARAGKTMTENHQILIDMGLSHEKLIYLCDMAIRLGALGAKLTGGGRGGYMVALTPGKKVRERVASAMEKEGYAVIRATVGGVQPALLP